MTMAALLHLDNNGYSLAAELIEKSGLTAEEW
jgi:siderophore synthetase component